VSAGHAHTCGIDAEGGGWCWGDDSRGQLGVGRHADKSATPLRVDPELHFQQLEAGYYATCGLSSEGAAWCWGLNAEGQAGDGTTEDRTEPVQSVAAPRFAAIDGGDRFACGVEPSGRPWCWGRAPLPDGTEADGLSRPTLIPTLPKLSRLAGAMGASTVSDADRFACGLAGTRLLCWGPQTTRLDGDGDRPVEPGPEGAWIAVTAGADHVCALAEDGRAWCAGANFAGQLGDGTSRDRTRLTPVEAPLAAE
jgi:alpha-tubulin suppressor-like RCC1 family protein